MNENWNRYFLMPTKLGSYQLGTISFIQIMWYLFHSSMEILKKNRFSPLLYDVEIDMNNINITKQHSLIYNLMPSQVLFKNNNICFV